MNRPPPRIQNPGDPREKNFRPDRREPPHPDPPGEPHYTGGVADDLHIEPFCLGEWMTFCYVVASGGRCWIVDAGFDPGKMIDYIEAQSLTLDKVVLTHAHVDHIAGLAEVRNKFPGVPILIHEAERDFLTDTALNLSLALDQPVVAPDATGFIADGDTLDLAGHSFKVLHVPGHSPGGIALYNADPGSAGVALVGDALFPGSIGNTTFPTSDHELLLKSIREKLYTLPDDTRVLPGHVGETTIGREKKYNPFVRA